MQAYKIDENGYYIKPVKIQDGKLPTACVKTQPPQGLYRAKWIGTEWTEDMTQEEIDALNNQPEGLTIEEKQQEIINTLGQELAMLKIQLIMGGVI